MDHNLIIKYCYKLILIFTVKTLNAIIVNKVLFQVKPRKPVNEYVYTSINVIINNMCTYLYMCVLK
jgi:hypothetical protein